MSLRYFSIRLSKNVWYFLQNFARVRQFKILDVNVANNAVMVVRRGPQQTGAPATSWARHVRNALFDSHSRTSPADLRRRIIRRLFYGDSKPLFALIGLTVSGGGLLSDSDKDDNYCSIIRDTVSNFLWKPHFNKPDINYSYDSISLDDLEIGHIFDKGCSGAICEAKVKESSNYVSNDAESTAEKKPLALKILFNYDIESNSIAILKGMYKETIPAQVCHISEKLPYWKNLFPTPMPSLPSHPNIVEIYHAFVDYMPVLPKSMDLCPDALPARYNGLGRNMTLFLLMKRYKCSLQKYLKIKTISHRDSVLLFTQLLEGIVHMNRHGIAHRDLKSDNILIDEINVGDDDKSPLLVITDFGCCFADAEGRLRMRYESDNIDLGGNINLMAPEIISQKPGFDVFLDFNKSDLWAVGAIAYEIFGLENPFSPDSEIGQENVLYSVNYEDSELPPMESGVHKVIQNLIRNLLSRNPKNRLSPEIAANICQLYLWAPTFWFLTEKIPEPKEINGWLLQLTTKIIFERKMFNSQLGMNPEYALITSFLSRVNMQYIEAALFWIKAQHCH